MEVISCESELETRRSMLKSPRSTADLSLVGGEIGEKSPSQIGSGQLREGGNKDKV